MLLTAQFARAGESLAALEEDAIKAAVARVAPSVVRIETVGGLERVGNVLLGSGSTTGLIISADGYIVSSAFNFAQKPDSILVTLAGGARTAAKLVATDHDRKLVLLKVEPPSPLTVPEAAPADQIQVGQWAIALGRTFDGDRPSISVGIVSAVERIWSKAIQTDAKISPSNYGGPLVDIRGRVLGVLSPLAPDAGSEVAGVDWYDSGIGFAIPLEHVLKVAPRLEAGHDLRPGVLGISLKSNDIFAEPAILGACRPNSPAFKAGLRVGDRIIEAAGHPVTRIAQLKMALGGLYAGDRVKLVATRGKERLDFEIELADKLPPFDRPFLGILPMRPLERESSDAEAPDAAPAAEGAKEQPPDKHEEKPPKSDTPEGDAPEDGAAGGSSGPARPAAKKEPVIVRYVYPGSPAAEAGIAPGDRVVSFAGAAVASAAELAEKLCEQAPGELASLEFEHDGAKREAKVSLAHLPESLPGALPPAHAAAPSAAGEDRPAVGIVPIKLPEFENKCIAYVPETYNPAVAHGLVIWLHGSERLQDAELVDRWRALCLAHDLILLAPRSADPARWQPTEAKVIRRLVGEVAKQYRIDPARFVVHGQEGGGSLAYLVALANRDLVRGVAVVDAPLPATIDPPDADPVRPLAFFMTRASKAPFTGQLDAGIHALRERKFPVSVVEVGAQGRYLTPTELVELARWIDTLDRL